MVSIPTTIEIPLMIEPDAKVTPRRDLSGLQVVDRTRCTVSLGRLDAAGATLMPMRVSYACGAESAGS